MTTEKTKTVSNPGFDDKQFTKQKFVDRWVNWAQDFGKLCDRDWDEFVKFQARVKELAEKQFDSSLYCEFFRLSGGSFDCGLIHLQYLLVRGG